MNMDKETMDKFTVLTMKYPPLMITIKNYNYLKTFRLNLSDIFSYLNKDKSL